jgi:hypothetical protein
MRFISGSQKADYQYSRSQPYYHLYAVFLMLLI